MSRAFDRLPRRGAAAVVAGLAVMSAVAAGVGWGVAAAVTDDKVTGVPVPARYVSTIQTAARSCPMLNPARLTAQLMAESGLKATAEDTTSGGHGIAGLDDGKWRKWTPWPEAKRSNATASILALAHQMCDLSGQLRVAKVPGDSWKLSLAAFRAGVPAVRQSGGVPESARSYVADITGYAVFYGGEGPFAPPGGGSPTTSPTSSQATPVPRDYVKLAVAGGSVCKEVGPPAIAALLMAQSAFNPNMLGAGGEQGVAQFRSDIWRTYGPPEGTAWETTLAIPAVGSALCGLIKDLSGIEGDPYLMAMVAFRSGTDAVRRGGGNFDAQGEAFLQRVANYTSYYKLDNRLSRPAEPPVVKPTKTPTVAPTVTAPPTTLAPSPSLSPTDTPPTSESPSAKPSPTKPKRTNQPPIQANGNMKDQYGPYFLENFATGMCFDLPGFGPGKVDGPVHQHECYWKPDQTDNQEFVLVPRLIDDRGLQLYWIRSTINNYCLDPPGVGDVKGGTQLFVTNCYDQDNQYFRLEKSKTRDGFQFYRLRNQPSNLCVDLPGTKDAKEDARLQLSECMANDDHDWALIVRGER